MKTKTLLLVLFIFTIFTNAYSGGGDGGGSTKKGNGGGTEKPVVPEKPDKPVSTRVSAIYLDFSVANNTKTPSTINHQERPFHGTNFNYSNSATTLDDFDMSNYYCEVKIKSENYEKSYFWKAGSLMNIEIPDEPYVKYTITVVYIEPYGCPIYTYGGNNRIKYQWSMAYTDYNAYYNAKLTYNGANDFFVNPDLKPLKPNPDQKPLRPTDHLILQ